MMDCQFHGPSPLVGLASQILATTINCGELQGHYPGTKSDRYPSATASEGARKNIDLRVAMALSRLPSVQRQLLNHASDYLCQLTSG